MSFNDALSKLRDTVPAVVARAGNMTVSHSGGIASVILPVAIGFSRLPRLIRGQTVSIPGGI